MRNETSPEFKELTATNNESVAIVPSAQTSLGTFQIANIPPTTAGYRNYAQHFHLNATITVDPDAAGNAIRADALFKALTNLTLRSPFLGDLYTEQQNRGSVLGLITDVVANGYWFDGPSRIEIPASTDADVTIDVTWTAPLAHEVLDKPSETTQWVGLFEGGIFQAVIGASTIYDTDYAGAVTKAPVTLRALVEYLPDRDNYLGCPFQWRERQVVNGGNQPTLTNMGGETNQFGVQPHAGVAWMSWLTDAGGVGLDGPDGVDNIVSVEIPWRGQLSIRNIDGQFKAFRRAVGKRVAPSGAVMGTTIIHENGGWPNTIPSTHNGRPSANASALFLPMIFPGKDFKTSKAQRLNGNLPVNFTFTTPVTGTHRFVTWELLEYTEEHMYRLRDICGWSNLTPVRMPLGSTAGRVADEGDLRYTRTMFV